MKTGANDKSRGVGFAHGKPFPARKLVENMGKILTQDLVKFFWLEKAKVTEQLRLFAGYKLLLRTKFGQSATNIGRVAEDKFVDTRSHHCEHRQLKQR